MHYHLGEAYRRLGMPEQALAEGKKAQTDLARPGTDQSYLPKITQLMKLAADDLAKKAAAPR